MVSLVSEGNLYPVRYRGRHPLAFASRSTRTSSPNAEAAARMLAKTSIESPVNCFIGRPFGLLLILLCVPSEFFDFTEKLLGWMLRTTHRKSQGKRFLVGGGVECPFEAASSVRRTLENDTPNVQPPIAKRDNKKAGSIAATGFNRALNVI